MSLRLCVLGSSSGGHAVYVASKRTGVLIDAGFSARELFRRLAMIGVASAEVSAVCVTHEHSDHTAGLSVLHRRHGLPLYANAGTIDGLVQLRADPRIRWNVFTTGAAFTVGDLALEPFSVPHDACDPVGFVVSHGGVSVGIATDMGMPTTLIRARLSACAAVVLESNHDIDMLHRSGRPWALIQRILGRQGHLSNEWALALLHDIAGPHLRHVFLAHLSQECNRGDTALTDARRALAQAGHDAVRISLTYPDRPSDVWEAVVSVD